MSWQKLLREAFTSLDELSAFLELPLPSHSRFPLKLPRRLANKIEKGNPHDPILLQFVPDSQELLQLPNFTADPVSDTKARCTAKSLKKYRGRTLLLTTGACAMHCRYCFRQHFDYARGKAFEKELSEFKKDLSLDEIILSGGDPLSLPDRILKELLDQLESISHLKRIRFHTRFPIGIPERITPDFLQILEQCEKQIWFVVHINHPKELDRDVIEALKAIQRLAIPVLNQSVLLKGVNDSLEVLKNLSESLINHGISPYYLHQIDRVEGGAHFEVSVEKGRELIEQLTEELSGYGIPRYVQEIAGKKSKTLL